MATPISGKSGNVKNGETDIAHVVDFNINDLNEVQRYASSDTAGVRMSVAGHDDWNGTISCLWDTTAPLVKGTSYTLNLYLDSSIYYSGDAMVESIGVKVPIGDGGIVAVDLSVVGNGALTPPS